MPDVRPLLLPRSLAVVGASPRNPAAVETVVRSGVAAWGVTPAHHEVAGLRCYPSFADLPERPEAALLMVNHERVEAAFEDAVAAGVRAFVVPGVGAEAGAAARPTTERLARRAREVDAALLGPNCMGAFVPGGPAAWNGLPGDTTAPGHVAILCQSGSVADAFLSLGGRIGIRCVVSSGAEAVTDAADFLRFFADDPETAAVGLFLETVRRPDAFVDALRRCAEADKPVACLKVGRSEAAARAALSHTGALVGSDRAFSAVLRRHAAIEVDDFHTLVETLEILGRRRRPRGARIGAISESGGECALLADHAEAAGVPFAPLDDGTGKALRGAFPNYQAPGNPLDAWGIADESEVYPRSLELLAASGRFDVLLGQADLSQFRDETNDDWCELTLRTLARLAEEHPDVFCAMTTVHSADPPRRFQELARELDVALLRGPRDTMAALAASGRFDVLLGQADLSQFRDETNDDWCELTLRTLARLADEHPGLFCAMTTVHSADPPRRFQELARELDVALLRGPRDTMAALAGVVGRRPYAAAAPRDGQVPDLSDLLAVAGALPEHESALALERFGIPFAPRLRAASPDDAAAAVDVLGAPVVVKLDGPAHKSRGGGVVVGLETPEAAAAAARSLGGPVLVARQVEPGAEVICGLTRDPDFGPILAVGRGGVAVEEADSLVLASAPLDPEAASALVEEAGIEDPGAIVARTLVALGDLALGYPHVESVEVNPLIVTPSGAVAVDALLVVADPPRD